MCLGFWVDRARATTYFFLINILGLLVRQYHQDRFLLQDLQSHEHHICRDLLSCVICWHGRAGLGRRPGRASLQCSFSVLGLWGIVRPISLLDFWQVELAAAFWRAPKVVPQDQVHPRGHRAFCQGRSESSAHSARGCCQSSPAAQPSPQALEYLPVAQGSASQGFACTFSCHVSLESVAALRSLLSAGS